VYDNDVLCSLAEDLDIIAFQGDDELGVAVKL
jgi:hypothetical protein